MLGLIHGPEEGLSAWPESFSRHYALAKKGNRGQVQAALGDFQPDLIYVHKMGDLEVVESVTAGSAPRVRMVHDHDIYCMRSYKYNYFSRKICTRPASPYCIFPCGASIARNHGGGFPIKWVSYRAKKWEIKLNRRFQRLVVYSQYSKQELVRNGFDPGKIEIHVPIQCREAEPVQSSFSDRNLLLFVGQIIRGKGVDVLLECLARIKTPFECIIVGEGNHRAHCEKLCRKLGLTRRVHFKGFVPQHELKQYYPECSVLVMSSVWPEPFGMVGPEAMRHGVPVVAFDAGGVKEWLKDGETGYLVPWMNRAKFAARIEELLLDKALARQMGKCGRESATRKYDFAEYIARLENMFRQVIAETQKGAPQ